MMSVGWRMQEKACSLLEDVGTRTNSLWRRSWPSIQYVEWKSTKENLNSRRSLRDGNTFSARRSAGKSSRISRRNLWRQRLRVGLHPVEEGLSLAGAFYFIGLECLHHGGTGLHGGNTAGRTWRPPLHLRLAVS